MSELATGTLRALRVELGMPTTKAVSTVNQSQRAIHSMLSTCLSHYDLTVAEWTIIGLLAESPHTPTELAKTLNVKTPYVAMLLRQLRHRNGIISEIAKDSDSRSKQIHLTTHGREFMASIETKLQGCMSRELVDKIAPNDLDTFFRVAEFIGKNVKHHD
jgi:DNA-binding MarR family transcriptional regulator